MDIKEEILAQMDSALRPEFDKAIDNTIEGAFKEDVKTLGFMVANSIKCQWEVMKPHLFYAYCLGVKAQAAKAQADQKVKLLLCDEHLKKCESPTGIFSSQYPDEEPCLICLAKEAKAQAVPEKDAVIKKLSDQLYAQEMKASAARVLCETACELLDDYAHQDAMVILNDLEQAMSTGAN